LPRVTNGHRVLPIVQRDFAAMQNCAETKISN